MCWDAGWLPSVVMPVMLPELLELLLLLLQMLKKNCLHYFHQKRQQPREVRFRWRRPTAGRG